MQVLTLAYIFEPFWVETLGPWGPSRVQNYYRASSRSGARPRAGSYLALTSLITSVLLISVASQRLGVASIWYSDLGYP